MGRVKLYPKIKENNFIGFMDETGILSDEGQRFFALGLLILSDTSILYAELWKLKNKVESFLDQKYKSYKKPFEFKFTKINKANFNFYLDLLELYFNFPDFRFCCFVLDKEDPKIDIGQYDTWDYYIKYSITVIKNNVRKNENLFVIADYLGKPNDSLEYWEKSVNTIPNVYNAIMVESHASLFIQLVDVLIGSVTYGYKIEKQSLEPNKKKLAVYEYVTNKLNRKSLVGGFTETNPSYFNVWDFCPKK